MPVFLSDIVEDTSGCRDGDEGNPSDGLMGTAPIESFGCGGGGGGFEVCVW